MANPKQIMVFGVNIDSPRRNQVRIGKIGEGKQEGLITCICCLAASIAILAPVALEPVKQTRDIRGRGKSEWELF